MTHLHNVLVNALTAATSTARLLPAVEVGTPAHTQVRTALIASLNTATATLQALEQQEQEQEMEVHDAQPDPVDTPTPTKHERTVDIQPKNRKKKQ